MPPIPQFFRLGVDSYGLARISSDKIRLFLHRCSLFSLAL